MIILQIGPYPQDPQMIRGGVEASVYGLSHELSKTEQVYVLDNPRLGINDSSETYDRIIVFRFNNPGPNQKDSVKRLHDVANRILSINPTICHIHGTGEFCYKILQKINELQIPVIVTVHGLLNVEKKNALKHHFSIKHLYQYIIQGYYERRLLASIDTAIVDTEYVASAIKGFTHGNVPELLVVPQGINQEFFYLNCSTASRIVLSVGSISKRKGHLMLVKAFEIAARELEDIELVICGIIAENAYYEELRDYISSLACKDRISLLTDVPLCVLYDLYRKAHIFALHSQEESQGIVFAEAMATGLPIVATRVGGVPYVVKEGQTGFLCEYGSINLFSDLLKKTLSPVFEWKSMSLKCKNTAQNYSWAAITDRIKTEYFRILK